MRGCSHKKMAVDRKIVRFNFQIGAAKKIGNLTASLIA